MSLEDIINRLRNDMGRNFEIAVVDAFNLLGFEAEHIEETQAESDVIVKAPQALRPYFIVVECEAVREGAQVSYTKLGQLRGNFPKYATRYKGFSLIYKLIVGKPEFSDDTIESSRSDTTLMTSEILIQLLEYNSRYGLSQDEIKNLFLKLSLIREDDIEQLYHMYKRKVKLYSFIFIGLLNKPENASLNKRDAIIHIERLIGIVKNLSYIKGMEFSDDEIYDSIRELQHPLVKIVERIEKGLKLSSLNYENMINNLRGYGPDFRKSVESLLLDILRVRISLTT